jgi:hypothetical protein
MITNCVNCVAPIDPKLDKCPYCGTSYETMGIKRDTTYEIKVGSVDLRAAEIQTSLYKELIYGISNPNELRKRAGLRGI